MGVGISGGTEASRTDAPAAGGGTSTAHAGDARDALRAARAAPRRRVTGPLDLRGANLIGEDLAGVDFAGSDLSGADLSCADLTGANLSACRLRETTLHQSKLEGAELLGADLTNANLNECDARRAGFGGATLSGATLVRSNLERATLSQATAHGSDLSAAVLRQARLRDSDLTEASLMQADLTDADLEGADVTRAVFTGADLHRARLRRIRGYEHATWIGVHLRDVDFSGAYLLRRFVMDQNYLHEFRSRDRLSELVYRVWWLTSDCGRSFARWASWVVLITIVFAGLFTLVEIDYGDYPTAVAPFYFSVATLTTLGYGDVLPASAAAQTLAVIEVVIGYIALGGLLSIFANKMGRRAD